MIHKSRGVRIPTLDRLAGKGRIDRYCASADENDGRVVSLAQPPSELLHSPGTIRGG
jgi:hypothetical protein